MKIAIHQPNFCCWYPLLKKIQWADVFVVMSHCQWSKGGFQNRFHIGDEWFTMSVNRGLEAINRKRYVTPASDWRRIKERLPQFRAILEQFDDCIDESLADTNLRIIIRACRMLGIKTNIVADYRTDLMGTDRLVDLCRFWDATEYMAGSGADSYMEPEKFGDITVVRQTIADENRISMLEAIERHQCVSC